MDKIEKYIVSRVDEILGTHSAAIVKRLLGGRSNYTYVVEADGKSYTYRVPGKNAGMFVDRHAELLALREVEPLDLTNKTVFFDIASGEKMAEYVEGTILSTVDSTLYSDEAAAALKKIHRSGIKLYDYDPFGRLARYEALAKDNGFSHPAEYFRLKDEVEKVYSDNRPSVLLPCHCDFQPSNLVLGSDRLYVLDWEYAGMNDPFYDIACHGDVGDREMRSLLTSYLGHKPETGDFRRMYNLRAFQCLQWYNVATIKDRIGLGEELKLDFSAIARSYIATAGKIVKQNR